MSINHVIDPDNSSSSYREGRGVVASTHTERFPGGSPPIAGGPWVNNPADPTNPTMGISMGDVMQFLTAAGITGQDARAMICAFP